MNVGVFQHSGRLCESSLDPAVWLTLASFNALIGGQVTIARAGRTGCSRSQQQETSRAWAKPIHVVGRWKVVVVGVKIRSEELGVIQA